MTPSQQVNRDQAALWNDASGRSWVEMQALLDRLLKPFAALLVDEAFPGQGGRVLDIGCGTGDTTLSMARRVGPGGLCLGVDISEPLTTAAKARAAAEGISSADFILADAQTHAFEPGSFDAVISRFGVMFFDDPVAAFANIRRAARPAARLAFVSWRSPKENPFMTTAARAAESLLPDLPKPDPNAPGQFAFADTERVQNILQASGWKNVDHRPVDITAEVAEAELFEYVSKLGPVGAALRGADDSTKARAAAVLRAAFAPFIQGGTARFTMACWLASARA